MGANLTANKRTKVEWGGMGHESLSGLKKKRVNTIFYYTMTKF